MSSVWIPSFIGIGANLGNAQDSVIRAIARIGALADTRLAAQSSLFRTAPVNASGDDYINAVVRVETRLPALQLLQALRAIEQDFGRERSFRNAPRTLDLDILLYGDQMIDSEELIVPHPRMTQRAFVLIPLLQIDPLISIPGKGPAHSFIPGVAGQAIQKI